MRPPKPLAALTGAVTAAPVGARAARTAAPSVRLSGAGGTAPAPDRPRPRTDLRAWAELLRVSALFTVPGDALAGAAAAGRSPGRGTALAVGASLCLYEAGMALNDWADRDEDAVERPHRPIPSGRIAPGAALTAAGVLTAAGLVLASRAGRPALAVASGLAATVWAYDLRLKHTPAGPAAMAAARSLDLLLGAVATGERLPVGPTTAVGRGATPYGGPASGSASGPAPASGSGSVRESDSSPGSSPGSASGGCGVPVTGGVGTRTSRGSGSAVPAALLLGAHTYAVTTVSRHEVRGGSTAAPLLAFATTTALGAATLCGRPEPDGPLRAGQAALVTTAATTAEPRPGRAAEPARSRLRAPASARALALAALTGAYLRTAAPPLLHAALNPSPPLTQRAVGSGIRAMIPLQAALAARCGAPLTGLAVMGLAPLARTLARKVSPT
ncbi:UbiA family prenyltransferase [Streptomyces sp. NBC_01754]|uniref:SCO3242 family prenyltransferase n=1 Tax=Streptomyces sp. NBC_01754 TaxID=2975930 RepID=UPI002DDC1CA9|nr:UbiA family prenyltransferase [Streptomyces sp. NBC_01754]WSC95958.1 UbiA family prenyltransferase [Streptomyces sp. NBC_01754]